MIMNYQLIFFIYDNCIVLSTVTSNVGIKSSLLILILNCGRIKYMKIGFGNDSNVCNEKRSHIEELTTSYNKI